MFKYTNFVEICASELDLGLLDITLFIEHSAKIFAPICEILMKQDNFFLILHRNIQRGISSLTWSTEYRIRVEQW